MRWIPLVLGVDIFPYLHRNSTHASQHSYIRMNLCSMSDHFKRLGRSCHWFAIICPGKTPDISLPGEKNKYKIVFLFSDDARIMTFLRGCKFSLEKTKRKLDMYFTMRALVPEFFSNRDPTLPEIKEVMKIAYVYKIIWYHTLTVNNIKNEIYFQIRNGINY